jgi:hypothetical protein
MRLPRTRHAGADGGRGSGRGAWHAATAASAAGGGGEVLVFRSLLACMGCCAAFAYQLNIE